MKFRPCIFPSLLTLGATLVFAAGPIDATVAATKVSMAKQRAIVCSLRLTKDDAPDSEIAGLFTSRIEEVRFGEMDSYRCEMNDGNSGLAFEIEGLGYKGTPIRGILAINEDAKTILGVRIYEHRETRTKGGKATQPSWLARFNDLPLEHDGRRGIVISSTERGPNVVDSVTGATRTTHSLQGMINSVISGYLSGGIRLTPLDLGLKSDAVTRATPGYPKQLKKPPHLRKEIRRKTMFVLSGTTNLALGMPVTCSMDFEPIMGDLDQVTDGVKKSGEFDFVELDPGPQWVQVDLGATCKVQAVVVWHYYKNPVIYSDVIVQASRKPEFGDEAVTLFNNDHDNSAGLGKGTDTAYFARWWGELVDARGDDRSGTLARYIRVYTNGGASPDDMTRFVEIAVYGIPAK